MFGTEVSGRGLSFVKILSGLNKTLSIANQVIPIYQQAKPMIQNAKNAFQVLKEFTSSPKGAVNPKRDSAIPQKVTPSRKKRESVSPTTSQNYSNRPVFFV